MPWILYLSFKTAFALKNFGQITVLELNPENEEHACARMTENMLLSHDSFCLSVLSFPTPQILGSLPY